MGSIRVKLIDFGFGCRILHGVRLKAKVGTFVYTAPEAIQGESCTEKLDMWALGCVLYVLLSGNAPFYGRDCRENIIQAKYDLEGDAWPHVSVVAKGLIQQLLMADPSYRLS